MKTSIAIQNKRMAVAALGFGVVTGAAAAALGRSLTKAGDEMAAGCSKKIGEKTAELSGLLAAREVREEQKRVDRAARKAQRLGVRIDELAAIKKESEQTVARSYLTPTPPKEIDLERIEVDAQHA